MIFSSLENGNLKDAACWTYFSRCALTAHMWAWWLTTVYHHEIYQIIDTKSAFQTSFYSIFSSYFGRLKNSFVDSHTVQIYFYNRIKNSDKSLSKQISFSRDKQNQHEWTCRKFSWKGRKKMNFQDFQLLFSYSLLRGWNWIGPVSLSIWMAITPYHLKIVPQKGIIDLFRAAKIFRERIRNGYNSKTLESIEFAFSKFSLCWKMY